MLHHISQHNIFDVKTSCLNHMMKLILSSFMTCSPIKSSRPFERGLNEMVSKYKLQVAKKLFQSLMPFIKKTYTFISMLLKYRNRNRKSFKLSQINCIRGVFLFNLFIYFFLNFKMTMRYVPTVLPIYRFYCCYI